MGLTSSIARSQYNELALAFQYRGKRTSLQANYTLSYASGYGGNVGGLFVSNAGGYLPEIPSAYGGDFFGKGEWGPGAADERHRVSVYGVIDLAHGFQVSPAFVIASALPYQIYRANSPSGYGALRCYAGNCLTPGPTGEAVTVNAARGAPLVNLNSRVSKIFKITESTSLTGFLELYNLIDRANFGANFGCNRDIGCLRQQGIGIARNANGLRTLFLCIGKGCDGVRRASACGDLLGNEARSVIWVHEDTRKAFRTGRAEYDDLPR